jgi:hypothetical protein
MIDSSYIIVYHKIDAIMPQVTKHITAVELLPDGSLRLEITSTQEHIIPAARVRREGKLLPLVDLLAVVKSEAKKS